MRGVAGTKVKSLGLAREWCPPGITSVKCREEGQFIMGCWFYGVLVAKMELETYTSNEVLASERKSYMPTQGRIGTTFSHLLTREHSSSDCGKFQYFLF